MVRLIQQPTSGVDLLDLYRQSGSPDVFAQIMRAYGGMVLSVCYKVTKDAADAEDASQAVFLTLAVQCKTGAPIQYLGPWLKKVAKRTALDLVRSRKRRTRRETVTAENRPEHYTTRPGAAPEADEQNAILRAELDQLPAKYRMPLVLHYFGGMSHDQISKEMNCTTAALGVRLHRARKMLGKRLAARNVNLEGAALAVALTTAVTTVFTERFIRSTTAAVAGLTMVQPMMSASLTASSLATGSLAGVAGSGLPVALPDNFAAVLQLVQTVGTSMARAKLRMAALAFAASLTFLGGAAEAVRCLPESIRPNLDFLAPSQLLKSLLEPVMPTMQSQAPPKRTPTITIAVETPAELPAPLPVAPPQQLLAAATNQPVLAMQWSGMPVPPPAPAAATSYALPKLALNAAASPRQTAITAMAAAATPAVVTRAMSQADAFRASGGGSDTSDSHPAPAAETPSSAAAPRTGGPGRGDRPLQSAMPDGDPRPNLNLAPPPVPVRSFNASAVGGATFDHIPVKPFNPLLPKPGPLALPTGPDAFVPDSAVVGRGDVFVPGDSTVHWSDAIAGISAGGTNSADFALSGVTGPGLLHAERLPVTTTAAPTRPTGHHFVGIWSLSSNFNYDTITLTAHYDEAFAESLGLNENILKLWVYDDSQWTRIMDSSFSRDLTAHSLTGTYEGMPQFFAVSAPEPTTLGLMAVAGGLLLRRRRKH